MKRFARLVLVLAILVPVAQPAAVSARTVPKAIIWKVDDDTKTITITVRLLLVSSCHEGLRCEISQIEVDMIRQAIMNVWNKPGLKYKCYTLVFDVDIEVDNTVVGPEPKDRVVVMIDNAVGTDFRDKVATFGGAGDWNSEDPTDKVIPVNDADNLTTWSNGSAGTVYAHEFGHIMGLDDTYVDKVVDGKKQSVRIEGAPVDVMSGGDLGNVDPRTVELLVKRSGVVTDAMIKCDYKVDTTVEWYHYFGIKCDKPEGAWQIDVDGERSLGVGKLVASGRVRVTLDPPRVSGVAPLEGTWGGYFRIDVRGVPVSTGGQEGTIGGRARFDQPANMQLVLTPTHSAGSYWSVNPHYAEAGAAQDPSKTLTLPVVNGNFCRTRT
jgi:hypothetical protein